MKGWNTLIDEEKVMLLGQLIRNTSAKVILHSGWKFWFDSEVKPLRREAERLISMLEKEGIKVNGVTPDHTTEEIRKSKIDCYCKHAYFKISVFR